MTALSPIKKPIVGRNELVVFAPYPPAKNGIGDYVAELMPCHLADFDVTLVIADDAPLPSDPAPRVLLATEFQRYRRHFENVPKLYHIGNNHHHSYMLDLLGHNPGIVVLHDFNLGYLHEMATLQWGDKERLIAAMEREYGAIGYDLVRWQLANEYRELFAGYELALNGEVLDHATAVITHSRQTQYRVAARVPEKPVWHVPHHLSPQAKDYFGFDKQTARSELGLPPDELVITAVGFVVRAKQITLALDALSSLKPRVPRFRFVLAGERRPHEYNVDADIAESELREQVICTDYLDEDQFFKHLIAADVIVNLRYPSAGEMSGTLIRALGLGKPTIIFDHGPMGELPDRIVKKIRWSDERRNDLTNALYGLLVNPSERSLLGSRAAEYVRREHDIARVADRYAEIVRRVPSRTTQSTEKLAHYFPHPRGLAQKLRSMGETGRQVAEECPGRIWWTVNGAPLGGNPSQRALLVSGAAEPCIALLCGLFDWDRAAVTAVSPDEFLAPTPTGPDDIDPSAASFEFALVLLPDNLKEERSAQLMYRINRALLLGGSLLMETWPSGGTNDIRPPSMEVLAQRLRDAGFASLRELNTLDGFISDLVIATKREEKYRTTCISARKVSEYCVWRFHDATLGLPLRWGGRTGPSIACR